MRRWAGKLPGRGGEDGIAKRVKYRVLGPLRIDDDNGAPTLVSPRERALVAVLFVFAGRWCPRDLLLHAVWGARQPANPPAALRLCVWRADRALGGGFLENLNGASRPGAGKPSARAYRAVLAPGDLDLHLFRHEREAAARLLEQGQLELASEALERALGCWRDPPLDDLPDAPEVAAERAGLLEQRRLAWLAYADTMLMRRAQDRILPQLRGRVITDPGCERSWTQLVQALYLSGRTSEALEFYSKAAEALSPPHGTGPGEDLQAVLDLVLKDGQPGGAIRIPAPRAVPCAAGMTRPAPVHLVRLSPAR
jgi:DNA-binding SARP family transcriptional activator